MKKVNTLLGLASLVSLSAPAQTSKDLYQDLTSKDKKEIQASGNVVENAYDLRSHTNKTVSAPTWKVIKPTDHGFDYDITVSLYFDPVDSMWVVGGGGGGMSVKDTNVAGYTIANSCFPFLANGFASYKDGDTLYRGTQSNGGIGGLVTQSTGGCGINSTILLSSNSKITSVEKYQGYKYVATSLDGLCMLDGNDTIIQRYTTQNSSLPTNTVMKLSKDTQGNLWVATGLGLVKITGSTRTVYNSANTGLAGFSSGLTDVKVDNNGVVWCGNIGLFKYISGSGRSQEAVPSMATGAFVVKGLSIDQFGNLWIATKNNGVVKRDGGTGQWTVYDTTTDPTIFTTNRVNAIAADTTDPTEMHIGIGSDASGFIQLQESTANYLPQSAGISISGSSAVHANQTYTYSLSTPIPNAQDYEWSYTGTGVLSLTPKSGGTQLDVVFGPGATLGNIVCKARNNYTKPVNDTCQLSFAITDIITGVEEHQAEEKITVAPNPTADMISVLNMQDKHIKSVEVYTTDWKQVKKQALAPGEEVKVNVEDLSAGSYIMLLKDAKGNAYPAKFIKR